MARTEIQRLVGRVALVERDEVGVGLFDVLAGEACLDTGKSVLDRADRFGKPRGDGEPFRRTFLERGLHDGEVVAVLLEVQLDADSSGRGVEDLVESRMSGAWLQLVVRDDIHTIRIATDVDLDEVGAAIHPARIAPMRGY